MAPAVVVWLTFLFRWTFAAELLPAHLQTEPQPGFSPVRMVPVPTGTEFPGAAAADALRFACFGSLADAESYFSREGLPFQANLIRRIDGDICHILFHPTLTGFLASTVDEPVKSLFLDVDATRFVSGRSGGVGDSLDILTGLARHLRQPFEIRIGLNKVHSPPLYQRAQLDLLGDTPHRIVLADNGLSTINPWPQDYLKSGSQAGRPVALITRRLFEGDRAKADLVQPALDRLEGAGFVRSQLSWEGGDLLVVRHPGEPGRRLLLFGNTAWNYWGRSLSREEYGYILRLEFGADIAVDMTQLSPHVDYHISFLPEGNTALVGIPVEGDLELACTASQTLSEALGPHRTEGMDQLVQLLCSPQATGIRLQKKATGIVGRLRSELSGWTFEDEELAERLTTFFDQACGDRSRPQCVERFYATPEGQEQMLRDAPDLFRDWVKANVIASSVPALIASCLGIIERQLVTPSASPPSVLEEAIRELEALGFRVLPVPQIPGSPGGRAWSGVSYVNSLLAGRFLFVPTFGLGTAEERMLGRIRSVLPTGYEVVPVYARYSILANGGVHCSVGVLRGSRTPVFQPLP